MVKDESGFGTIVGDIQTEKVSWLDISNCTATWFSAIGTVGAVIVSLALAYGDSHRKIRPDVKPLYSVVMTQSPKAFKIELRNQSNHRITIEEIYLVFGFSTKQSTYSDDRYVVTADDLRYNGDEKRIKRIEYPLHIEPRTIRKFEVPCDDSEVGESIAKLLSEATSAFINIEVIDGMGRLSHGKRKRIRRPRKKFARTTKPKFLR